MGVITVISLIINVVVGLLVAVSLFVLKKLGEASKEMKENIGKIDTKIEVYETRRREDFANLTSRIDNLYQDSGEKVYSKMTYSLLRNFLKEMNKKEEKHEV